MNAHTTETTPLTDEEVARYHRDGLLVPDYRVPEDLLQRMRDSVMAVIESNPTVRPELLSSVNLPDGDASPSGSRVRGDAIFVDYARHPEFLDIVSQILGPDLILWVCSVFCKAPRDGRAIHWHQDSPYYVMRPVATCSVWIALDDSHPGNGCMRFIPGSHRRGVLRHIIDPEALPGFNDIIDPRDLDVENARDVSLKAGQISLHDAHTVHGSSVNQSAQRRAGLVFRYMPGSSYFDRSTTTPLGAGGKSVEPEDRPIYLVRGCDRTGRNDFSIGRR